MVEWSREELSDSGCSEPVDAGKIAQNLYLSGFPNERK